MVGVVAQEGAPGLARRAPRSTPAITPNRAIADHDAQFEQLTPDPFGAPQPVLARRGHNEVPDLGAEVWPAASGAGLPAPEQAPALAMPAHDRIRRDEAQVLAPAGTPAASQHPEELVPGVKPSTRSGAGRPGQDGKLVAQQQVLSHEVAPRA